MSYCRNRHFDLDGQLDRRCHQGIQVQDALWICSQWLAHMGHEIRGWTRQPPLIMGS